MIILKQQADEQTLRFIPRSYGYAEIASEFEVRVLVEGGTFEAKQCLINSVDEFTVVLRNETTNEVKTISATFSLNKYYLETSMVFDLLENTFYNLTIKNYDEIVYKDKVFCTNQDIVDYTVNKNEYVSNATNNDFIIYE